MGTCQNSSLGISVPRAASALADVVDLGTVPLDQVSAADMPDPNTAQGSCQLIQAGRTYLVYHYRFDTPNSFVLEPFTFLTLTRITSGRGLSFAESKSVQPTTFKNGKA